MVIMETKNLTKYYGKARGIIDLNLRVHEGDIFGFIGPNGAGKSTTIRILLGLINPTSGNATIFGKDCRENKKSILADIGYMPSEAMFWGGMKVSEVVDLSAKLHNKNCTEEAKILCDRLQLDTKKKVEELSLGNRRKVSIVCALQHKPKLYILDEPTSGLDPLMQKEFWSLMEERHNEGATIFLSSHVLSEVQRHCKNAAIIREGKLIVADSVTKLSQTATRRITLQGISAMPPLEGIKDLILQEDIVSFLYQGEMQKLISTLNNLTITDMTVLEPTLEEVFLHYYEKDGE